MGRIETAKTGEQVLAPIHHSDFVLSHQQKVAALIAAAYLYRDEPNSKHISDLLKAARNL